MIKKQAHIISLERELHRCEEQVKNVVVINSYTYDRYLEHRNKIKNIHSDIIRRLDALKQSDTIDDEEQMEDIKGSLKDYRLSIHLLEA